jgi:hypothetical protein
VGAARADWSRWMPGSRPVNGIARSFEHCHETRTQPPCCPRQRVCCRSFSSQRHAIRSPIRGAGECGYQNGLRGQRPAQSSHFQIVSVTFPAGFVLGGAVNRWACGFLGVPRWPCRCTTPPEQALPRLPFRAAPGSNAHRCPLLSPRAISRRSSGTFSLNQSKPV